MKKILLKIRRFYRAFLGKDFFVEPDVDIGCEYYGSSYGGFTIARNFLSRESVVFSFGVGKDISFDLALIERFNCTIYAFDPTPESIKFMESQNLSDNLKFYPYGLAATDDVVYFNPPEDSNHISHTILDKPDKSEYSIKVKVYKLSTILNKLEIQKIDLLKMDIEGAEYEVIEDIKKTNVRPKQIVLEFHHRFKNVGIDKSKNAIKSLKNIGYKVFSVSESGEEFSLMIQNNND